MNSRFIILSLAVTAMAIASIAPAALADNEPVGTAFTYQGVLSKGLAPANQPVNFTFRLYNAEVGGDLLGSAGPVLFGDFDAKGHFTIDIDFGAGAFTGGERWLEVQVDQTTLAPRQPLMPTPHAMVAGTAVSVPVKAMAGSYPGITGVGTLDSLLVNGNVGIGTASPAQKLHSVATGVLQGAAIYGQHTSFTGNVVGIWGEADSDGGRGIFGRATSANGVTTGVHGVSNSPDGRGVWGMHSSFSGTGAGVLGQTNSQSASAVGVHGVVLSPVAGNFSAAVRGEHLGTGQAGYGVHGTHDAGGVGVFGQSMTGTGIIGEAFSPGVENRGIWGRTNSASGFAAYFTGPAGSRNFFERNVGIGTTTPEQLLHVRSSSPSLLIENTSNSPAFLRFRRADDDPNDHYIAVGSVGQMVMRVGGTDRIWIRNDGRMGINNNSPNSQLQISAAPGNNALRAQISGTTRLLVHDNGNVAIGGDIAPDVRLHVVNGSDAAPSSGGFLVLGSVSGANVVLDNNEIMARNNGATATLFLNHEGGDVRVGQASGGTGRVVTPILQITGGADLSERFDVAPAGELQPLPGMVVCIDPANPGKLVLASRAYDRTVAGVISGAGGINSGMIMGQESSIADGAHPVALTGRVYVMAEASERAIEPGDLLTTSDRPGHAMAVDDVARMHGAVIGKAMTALMQGERGLVLVLVNLQ